MENKRIQKPIFIVGHSRSGSTLLASVLGRHPNIHALPETHYFNVSYSGLFIKRLLAYRNVDELLAFAIDSNVRLKDVGFIKKDVKDRLKGIKFPNTQSILDAIFELELYKSGKQRILEKTPFHIEYIDRILKWYPDAKVICTIRDPRDAIDSLIRVPWIHSNPQRHAAYWNWCVREAHLQQRKHPDQVTILRYEDLVITPDETLQRILEFLGEHWVNDLLDQTVVLSTIPDWEKDWKENSASRIDGKAAFKWKKSPQKHHADWSSWTRLGIEMMHYDRLDVNKASQSLIYNDVFYPFIYSLWRVFRSHISERKNKYRREMISRNNNND